MLRHYWDVDTVGSLFVCFSFSEGLHEHRGKFAERCKVECESENW